MSSVHRNARLVDHRGIQVDAGPQVAATSAWPGTAAGRARRAG